MKNIWIIDHYSSEPKYGGIQRQYDFAVELSQVIEQYAIPRDYFFDFWD